MEECHKKRPKEVMMKRKSSYILENHIYSCVSNDLEKGNLEIIDEMDTLVTIGVVSSFIYSLYSM